MLVLILSENTIVITVTKFNQQKIENKGNNTLFQKKNTWFTDGVLVTSTDKRRD